MVKRCLEAVATILVTANPTNTSTAASTGVGTSSRRDSVSSAASISPRLKEVPDVKLEWTQIRSFLRKPDFMKSLMALNPDDMSNQGKKLLYRLVTGDSNESLSLERVERASKASGVLLSWLLSLYQYHRYV